MVINSENEKMDFQPIRRARLAKLIKENFDGSQSKFVDATGENQGEISGLLHSKSFGEKKARKIERLCNLPIGWLDHEDDPILPSHGFAPVSVVDSEDPNFIEIRKIKLRLSAGISGFAVDQDEEDGGLRMTFHKSWFVKNGYSPDKLVAVKVRGESMETTLHENDTVVVNTADRTPKDGEVFAVNYEGEAVIKRMVRDIGQWWLSSDNPDQRKYHRKVCQGDACIIIGKVILHQTERI